MVFYIAIKDFISFYRKEKGVFGWLIVSMIVTSFLLNSSYSFAKERGNLYSYAIGAETPRVWVFCDKENGLEKLDLFLDDISKSGLPSVEDYVISVSVENGITVLGTDNISPKTMDFSGIWTEGYYHEIKNESGNECAVDSSLLDYGNKLKMTGESFELCGKQYVIRGVYEDTPYADVMIFKDEFKRDFDSFDVLALVFDRNLSVDEKETFESISYKSFGNTRVEYNDEKLAQGDAIEKTHRVQYSIFILLLVVFITYIIRFWHERNISTYTIYRLNGATTGKIVAIIATEALLLGVSTYVLGLAADALLLLVIHKNLITLESIGFGFALFFVPMFILTVTNAVQLCKGFNITDIRRD